MAHPTGLRSQHGEEEGFDSSSDDDMVQSRVETSKSTMSVANSSSNDDSDQDVYDDDGTESNQYASRHDAMDQVNESVNHQHCLVDASTTGREPSANTKNIAALSNVANDNAVPSQVSVSSTTSSTVSLNPLDFDDAPSTSASSSSSSSAPSPPLPSSSSSSSSPSSSFSSSLLFSSSSSSAPSSSSSASPAVHDGQQPATYDAYQASHVLANQSHQGLATIYTALRRHHVALVPEVGGNILGYAYIYDTSKAVWKPSNKQDVCHDVVNTLQQLVRHIIDTKDPIQRRKAELRKLHNALGNVSMMRAIESCLESRSMLMRPDFEATLNVHEPFMLPIRGNLVWDLKQHTAKPRTAEHRFTFHLDVDYVDRGSGSTPIQLQLDWSDSAAMTAWCEEERKIRPHIMAFLLTLMKDDPVKTRYLQRMLGSFLCFCASKEFFMLIGPQGNNGKSAFMKVAQGILGREFYVVAEKSVLVTKRRQQSPAPGSTSPQFFSIRKARVIGLSETDATDVLNAEEIKRITGGDARSSRQLYSSHQVAIEVGCKPVIFSNHMPVIPPSELSALRDRLRYLSFDQKFSTQPNLAEGEVLADEQVVNDLLGKYRNETFSFMVDGFPIWNQNRTEKLPEQLRGEQQEAFTESMMSQTHEPTDGVFTFLSDMYVHTGCELSAKPSEDVPAMLVGKNNAIPIDARKNKRKDVFEQYTQWSKSKYQERHTTKSKNAFYAIVNTVHKKSTYQGHERYTCLVLKSAIVFPVTAEGQRDHDLSDNVSDMSAKDLEGQQEGSVNVIPIE